MRTAVENVKSAFLAVHQGRSTDDVVIDPGLNEDFLLKCKELDPTLSSYDANWKLYNLRKSAALGGVTTSTERLNHADYVHAAQIAARLMEDRLELTIDRVLCNPEWRDQFDQIATEIAPDISVYRLRKAALGLRKARRLRPELIKRVADWGRRILEFPAAELIADPEKIPRQPGIYIFRDSSGYLYIGEADNLRLRVATHLDHSDRKLLAHYLWENGVDDVSVELHAFASDSDARKVPARRAYESDLIASRSPRFNIRP